VAARNTLARLHLSEHVERRETPQRAYPGLMHFSAQRLVRRQDERWAFCVERTVAGILVRSICPVAAWALSRWRVAGTGMGSAPLLP